MAVGSLIGGALGLAGSLFGGDGGAGAAADASVESTRLATQTQKEIYGQNKQTLQPFINTGTAAMGNINALLGITPTQPTQSPAQTPRPGGMLPGNHGMAGAVLGGMQNAGVFRPPTAGAAPAPGATPAPTQPTAQQAFDTYRNSTGYQFRVNEGMDAVNSGYAGAGTLQSGAAMQAINDYGQGMASQEFGNYMNSLGNQQALGMSGASALAGVGQNYANSLGNIQMQNGENLANAALVKGQNKANMWGGIANSLGGMLGGL